MRITTIALILTLTPLTALADSPFSPDFMLKPYQIESSSQLNYRHSTYDIDSIILKNRDTSRFIDYTQSLSIGLPNDFSVGIAEVYAKPLHKNPLNPGEGKSGFKSPYLSANKRFTLSDNLNVKFSVIAQPNLTGSSELLNTYQLIGLATFKPTSKLDLSIGYNRTRYELAGTDADIFNIILSRKFNEDVLLNVAYGVTKWSATETISGNFDSSVGHTFSVDLSKYIDKDMWIGMNASFYSNDANFTGLPPFSIPFKNKTDFYTGGVTLKYLF